MTTPKPITVERLSDWERSVDEDSYRDVRATVEALDAAQKRIAFLEQRERDICAAVGGVSDGGQYRNDIIEHLLFVFKCADQAKARIAELEAENADSDSLIERQSSLLTAAVNVLRGAPPVNMLWSHHDIADIARQLVDRAHAIESERDSWKARAENAEKTLAAVQEREKAHAGFHEVEELTRTLFYAVQNGAGCCGPSIGRGSRLRQVLDRIEQVKTGEYAESAKLRIEEAWRERDETRALVSSLQAEVAMMRETLEKISKLNVRSKAYLASNPVMHEETWRAVESAREALSTPVSDWLSARDESIRSEILGMLADPQAVRANILRGVIKVPSDLVWLHDTDGPVAKLLRRTWERAVKAQRESDRDVADSEREALDETPLVAFNPMSV